jgi:hypothetical protein
MDQWLRINGGWEVRWRDVSSGREFEGRVSIRLEGEDGELDVKYITKCAHLLLVTMYERTIAEFQDLEGESGSRALWVAILEGEIWGASVPAYRKYIGSCVNRVRYFVDRNELEADCGVDGVEEGGYCFLLGKEDWRSDGKKGWESRDKRVCC